MLIPEMIEEYEAKIQNDRELQIVDPLLWEEISNINLLVNALFRGKEEERV